uniref:Predicted protein n=1 Tax=Hordeum vulgare subsp. vulgare TaxID=112509 RepID=F2EAP3_HORVV|nr:predicted protein [Hordeum vulgare subsp. vulgare]
MQRQQRFSSLSSFYARRYPQNVVRRGDQAKAAVFRLLPRSETAPTRAASTCVSPASAEVAIEAITAGAVTPVGLALGRCTIATRNAAHRRPAGSSAQTIQRDVC